MAEENARRKGAGKKETAVFAKLVSGDWIGRYDFFS